MLDMEYIIQTSEFFFDLQIRLLVFCRVVPFSCIFYFVYFFIQIISYAHHPVGIVILHVVLYVNSQVHICMSRGETFPSLHGQLDVNGLAFQIIDAPSCFSVSILFVCS